MRGTFGTGPLGTGSYLVGHRGSWVEPQVVEVWFLVLFFPLVPLSRWSVAVDEQRMSVAERGLDLTVHARSRVALGSTMRRIAGSLGVVNLALLPLAFGTWKIGSPWATPLLTTVLGWAVSPGILGKLGMAVEMGVVLGGAVIPIILLMLLDEHTPRVPLRWALGLGRSEGAT